MIKTFTTVNENFKDSMNRITKFHDFCYDLKDSRYNLETIISWRPTRLSAMQALTKYDNELNYMKSIEAATSSFDESITELVSAIEEESNQLDRILEHWPIIIIAHEKLDFMLKFFAQLNYFNNNIVAIGANGCGKTSLADSLRQNLNNNGLVISAQRVLFIPTIESLPTLKLSEKRLDDLNKKSRTFKNIEDFLEVKEEFGYVLKNLIVKHCDYALQFLESSKISNLSSVENKPRKTDLENVIEIWNDLFDYRKLQLTNGVHINVILTDDISQHYEPIKLSEGEKAALYIIAQISQAPKKGFIIIDEPEMYLHKTIISRLWDRLENFRSNCIFIYLTHDLDFATNRISAKKVWLKSFIYPSTWDIQEIADTEMPERLVLELLGSRKNILFCEGEKGSIDERIYKVIFPKATVVPVGSCLNVINFTKAFNRIPLTNTEAYGLIDADHHETERLDAIRRDNIFHLPLAEVENLFLDEDFLMEMAARMYKDTDSIRDIKKEVLSKLDKEKEVQASQFVSSKVNDYFKDTHVNNGNSFEKVASNYDHFQSKINLEQWYSDRISFIEGIIKRKDYNAAIGIYNNKGLQNIAGRNLSTSNYTEHCIKHILNDSAGHRIIKNVFPASLIAFFS